MAHPAGQFAHAPANDVQSRLPGPNDWGKKGSKDKWGTAGVRLDQRRKSPIVEISMLLVGPGSSTFEAVSKDFRGGMTACQFAG